MVVLTFSAFEVFVPTTNKNFRFSVHSERKLNWSPANAYLTSETLQMLNSALFVYIRDGIVAVVGWGRGGIQSAADFALH